MLKGVCRTRCQSPPSMKALKLKLHILRYAGLRFEYPSSTTNEALALERNLSTVEQREISFEPPFDDPNCRAVDV